MSDRSGSIGARIVAAAAAALRSLRWANLREFFACVFERERLPAPEASLGQSPSGSRSAGLGFWRALLAPEHLPAPPDEDEAASRSSFFALVFASDHLPEPPDTTNSNGRRSFFGEVVARDTLPPPPPKPDRAGSRSFIGSLFAREKLPPPPQPTDPTRRRSFLHDLFASESLPPADQTSRGEAPDKPTYRDNPGDRSPR